MTYRETLARRMERNRRRLLYDQDGRGHALTLEQRHALVIAVRADDRDWFGSWLAEVLL